MSNFCERINELLEEREIKPEKLAVDINVSVQTVYDWKAGNQQIFLSNLITLCDYLKCSVDFIAGRSDIEKSSLSALQPPFYIAIKTVMEKKGVSTYRLRKETRFDGSYFARWKKGAQPYLSTLIELADYFNCTIDELIGRER